MSMSPHRASFTSTIGYTPGVQRAGCGRPVVVIHSSVTAYSYVIAPRLSIDQCKHHSGFGTDTQSAESGQFAQQPSVFAQCVCAERLIRIEELEQGVQHHPAHTLRLVAVLDKEAQLAPSVG